MASARRDSSRAAPRRSGSGVKRDSASVRTRPGTVSRVAPSRRLPSVKAWASTSSRGGSSGALTAGGSSASRRPSFQSTSARGQCMSIAARACCRKRRVRRGSVMTRPSVWGSCSLPMRATAPRDRSAPRWRARRTSDSRLTASPAISSSMRSPRRRDSVSVRTSSRARSSAQASASSASAASTRGRERRADPRDQHADRARRRPSRRARLRPGISSSMNGPMTEAGPWPRARTTAASSTASCSSVEAGGAAQVEVLVEDRDRRAEDAARGGGQARGSPGRPTSGARSAARAAQRARQARALLRAAATRSAITAPQGAPGGQHERRDAQVAGRRARGRPRPRSPRAASSGGGARAEQQRVGLVGRRRVGQGERRHRPLQVGGGRHAPRAGERRDERQVGEQRPAVGRRGHGPGSGRHRPEDGGRAPPVSSGPRRRGGAVCPPGERSRAGVWPGVTKRRSAGPRV